MVRIVEAMSEAGPLLWLGKPMTRSHPGRSIQNPKRYSRGVPGAASLQERLVLMEEIEIGPRRVTGSRRIFRKRIVDL